MYLGLAGTGVPVRPSEVEGRPGKQPDGPARTREVRLVTVRTAESHDKRGRPLRDPGSVSDNAAVESVAAGRVGAGRLRCRLSGRFEDFRERRAARAA